MGSCFSKKRCSKASSSPLPCPNKPSNQIQIAHDVEKEETLKKKNSVAGGGEEEGKKEEERVKREVFVIKHRKSHDGAGNAPVSPNSEKEEMGIDCKTRGGVDAVSTPVVRTSSCTKEEVDAILIQCGRLSRSSSGKAAESAGFFTGSGRRYSGSKRSYDFDDSGVNKFDDNDDDDDGDDKRRHRRQRDHRRSRSSPHGRRRTPSREAEQRSGSRDRGTGSGGGRRVSRSPGRRSENTSTATGNSSAIEKSSSAQAKGSSIRPSKMVSVPASVSGLPMDKSSNGGAEANGNAAIRRVLVRRNSGASPRSQSPANLNPNPNPNNNQQQPSLSRSSSKKKEQSPYRRNPLSEIDNNLQNRRTRESNTKELKPSFEMNTDKSNKEGGALECSADFGADNSKPQALTRSRSSTRSRDFDYNALLLEDIQNFHQKKTSVSTANATAFSLPACLTKANSILEAVADLNSGENSSNGASEKRRFEATKDPVLESNFHKYVTVKRGSVCREELEEEESSGSNSFVTQQNWVSSSSSLWEPSSADSTDRWTSSRSNAREESYEMDRRRLGGIQDHQRADDKLGRGRVGNAGRGLGRVPPTAPAATAST